MFGFFGDAHIELNKLVKTTNSADYEYECKKRFADKYAEARIAIKNEKDPVRRERMSVRLALGITDFSDL